MHKVMPVAGVTTLRLLIANTGYWMPFEAAKAVAATFCWRIRYALTPVFGPDFPQTCLRPEWDGFGSMVIDPAITEFCTKQASLFRQLEIMASCGSATMTRSPLTPESPTFPKQARQLRPKVRHLIEPAGEYNSDSSFEECYLATSVSPAIPHSNTWTAANTPRSVGPLLRDRLPSPREILAGLSENAAKADEEDRRSAHSASTSSTTSLLLKSRQGPHDEDEAHDNGIQGSCAVVPYLHDFERGRLESASLSDKKAAYLLLKLSMEAGVDRSRRIEKRRASA